MSEVFRSGFACFVGRPNAGKSTLTNALVGSKIAIASSKPQTTRHAIRGIVTRPDAQLILVDTPGLHRPRTVLGQRLNDVVRETLTQVDVVGFCLPSNEKVGPGDAFIAAELTELRGRRRRTAVIAIATKADLVDRDRLGLHLLDIQRLGEWDDIVPCSALAPPGQTYPDVSLVADLMVAHLPPGPALYPDGELTDEPEAILVAELVREAALEGVRDELPHSIAVVVEEMQVEGGLTRVFADIHVERSSQKAIVIGHKGSRLKEIGTRARPGIEDLLGTRVYLDLHVRVTKEWQRDPKQLRKLGF
jgi:GTP-binding protein Era